MIPPPIIIVLSPSILVANISKMEKVHGILIYETLFYLPLKYLLLLEALSKTVGIKLRGNSSAITFHLKDRYFRNVENFDEAKIEIKRLSYTSRYMHCFQFHTNNAFVYDLEENTRVAMHTIDIDFGLQKKFTENAAWRMG